MKKEEWIKKLKPYWKEYIKIEKDFFDKVNKLEERMRKECKNENLEFAYDKMGFSTRTYFGIGFDNLSRMKKPYLIHDTELED